MGRKILLFYVERFQFCIEKYYTFAKVIKLRWTIGGQCKRKPEKRKMTFLSRGARLKNQRLRISLKKMAAEIMTLASWFGLASG